MKTKIFCLLVACLVGFQSFGQTIEGLLLDSLTNEPLAFATVKMESKAQTNSLKAEIANDKGTFKFVGVKKDKYLIKVEYVGYKTKIVEVEFDKISESLNLGAISLSPISQLLESLVVNGLKPNVISTLEKQVFKAEQFEVAKGGTATDVLKNIPSVMVNAEGEIMVRGSKGFLVLINGKPSQIDAATLLAQIPANTIEKVEMITAPSAKYDADGKAGIINIITKSGTTNGINAIINTQYGLPRIESYYNFSEPQRYGIDGTISYKKNKWETAVSLNYLKNDIAGRRIGDANTTIDNIMTSFPSEGERSFKRANYGLRAISTYKFSSNDELSGGIYLGEKNQYRTANIYYDNSKTNLLTKEIYNKFQYYNANLVLKSGSFRVYNLDYLHAFNKKSSLSLSGLYEYALLDGYTKNRNLNQQNFGDTLQYTVNNGSNPLNALRLKADYEQTIGTGKLAVGYQFRNQNQKGVFDYQEKAGNFTPLVINPEFSSQIAVNNTIHGIYSQYHGIYKKLEYATGLRYENAYREFRADKNSEKAILKLSNLFPSANLLYNLKSDLRLKLAYSRRVQRSTNNELNPYPEREHSETLEQGDPNIRPEFIGIYEAGVTKDFKKASFFWNVYAQQITDIVNRVNSVYNDSILNRVYTNAGKAQLFGTESNVTYSPTKKLKFYLGANLYNLRINGTLFDNSVAVNTRGWVYSVNTNFNYQITPTFNTQFNLSYLSARNTAQGEDSRFYQPNFTLKKTLDKFILSLLWQNASIGKMNVNQQRITTFGKDFYTTTNYIQEVNIFMFNLSYNFSQNPKKMKLPNSEFGEKEF
jgi:ferric enterobactin receptor